MLRQYFCSSTLVPQTYLLHAANQTFYCFGWSDDLLQAIQEWFGQRWKHNLVRSKIYSCLNHHRMDEWLLQANGSRPMCCLCAKIICTPWAMPNAATWGLRLCVVTSHTTSGKLIGAITSLFEHVFNVNCMSTWNYGSIIFCPSMQTEHICIIVFPGNTTLMC